MTKSIKLSGFIILATVIVCGTSYLTDKNVYSNWKITNSSTNKGSISWAIFKWGGDTLGGKYYERTAMQIPCKIEGLPNIFTFQFDLGSGLTGVYENTFSSFYCLNGELKNKILRLKSPLQFWNKRRYFRNFKISFGNYIATHEKSPFYDRYGEKISLPNSIDTFHLGTIGTDLFKNKVLIIDYPNERFAICDNMPEEYEKNLIDIEINNFGKVILPMKLHHKSYRITFDNGSSLFPLMTLEKNISTFSTLPDIDTIQIPSWGEIHAVTGKMMKDTFELAGQKYSNVKVYANHSGLGIDNQSDGITGNALFWDKTIVIDFKTKKFGIK